MENILCYVSFHVMFMINMSRFKVLYCEMVFCRENGRRQKTDISQFAKVLRSLEQFIQTVKGRKNFCFTECFSNLFVEVSHIKRIRTIQIQIGRNYWDLETCSKCFLFAYKVRKIPKWITQ